MAGTRDGTIERKPGIGLDARAWLWWHIGGNLRAEYIPADRLRRIRDRLTTQDKLIMDTCIETGARIDDVLCLRGIQHDSKEHRIALLESKTNKRRVVTITPELSARLREQQGSRHHFAYIFRGLGNASQRRKPHRSTFWRHMVKAAELCGYRDNVYTPHSLRKIYAVNLLHKTRSLEAVRRDLGHKHLTTTMLYALSDRQDELGLY